MRYLNLWTIFLFALFTSCSTQKAAKAERLAKELEEINEKDSECGPNKNYSIKERLKFYPFNKAEKVVLISFDETGEYFNITPVAQHKTIDSLIKETVTLKSEKIEELTHLLYNIGYQNPKAKLHIVSHASCYNPRNAILFMNKYNKVIDYISICFQCNRHELSSRKIKDINYCLDKYSLLANFFKSSGIKIGTTLPPKDDEQ